MTSPAAGWYPAPDKPGMLRWWDGNGWTAHETFPPPVQPSVAVSPPAPTAPPVAMAAPQPVAVDRPTEPAPSYAVAPVSPAQVVPAPSGQNGLLHLAAEGARAFAASPTVQGVGIAGVGAALAADGAAGLGKKRKGIGHAVGMVIWGLVIVAVAIVVLITSVVGAFSGATTSSGEPVGSAIPGSFLLLIAGVALTAWGMFKAALRAGSMAGGLALIHHGLKRGKGAKGDSRA